MAEKKKKKAKVEEGHLSVRKEDADFVREIAEKEDRTIRSVVTAMRKAYEKERGL